MRRPVTTLFMLSSVDGKISTGADDSLDVDTDFPLLDGVKEGLHQYYKIERTTDLWSLNSGRVQAKVGVNERDMPSKSPVSFVVIDSAHLTERGVRYFCELSKLFVLVTTNANHPAYAVQADNLRIIYQPELNPRAMLELLYSDFGCERITIQTGGTLNALFLREKLFDFVDIVVAPVLIGGRDTATLIDGASLVSRGQLGSLGALKLENCEVLQDSYLRLRYSAIK
ncbi:MAG: dihydrofolate reductase family protein [Oscillospiraceae bacterium]|nr:dihydrofolate reductase family protein [Oscillospiraceae bacterium]